jgi:hypothetical protein
MDHTVAYRAKIMSALETLLLCGDVEIKKTENAATRLLLKRPKDESVESFLGRTPAEAIERAARKYTTIF